MASEEQPPRVAITFRQFAELKRADRAELRALSADEAQASVERVLYPRLWRIENPERLAWPGDLADDEEGD